MSGRRYVLKERARSQQATRQRIVEAAAELHEEVGPRDSTISAIAQRAGVQRLTVYRHFPDEADLFNACTSHWLAINPPPDPAAWAGLEGGNRCRRALGEIYSYYRGTGEMWAKSHRDLAEVPALAAPMARFQTYLDGIRDELILALRPPTETREAVAVTLAHALSFPAWRSLADRGLTDAAMADLVLDWLSGIAPRSRHHPSRAGISAHERSD